MPCNPRSHTYRARPCIVAISAIASAACPARKTFKKYPLGYFHLDIAEVRTEEGKLYLFVAIDRTSKFAYAELHHTSDRTISTAFLRHLIGIVPYKIHTLLTDNGSQFCHPLRYRNGSTA
jgi:hypothetical protein